MKASIRYTVLLALVLAVILILLVTITTPLVYSLEKDTFPSRFHNNTDALKRQSLNSSEDILPLMQELSGNSGPIILNVRLDDPEQARRDLQLFAKNRVAFDNLIVKLDMTESEMQEYSKNRALQNQLLSELVNSSVSLDELKKLEVQYRNADNPTMLMSVQLEGDALHDRIRELYDQYKNTTASTAATGKKMGIDTSQEEATVVSFRQYVEETAPPARSSYESSYEVSPRGTNLLTFLLIPERVRYGDTLGCSGYLFSPVGLTYVGIPDKNVTLFIDNEPVSVTGTDSSGAYAVQLPIERFAAGSHAVHAVSGTTLSETILLTVDWADSITTLSKPVTNKGSVTITGTVTAGVPVRNAMVDIISNGTVMLGTVTDARGQFRAVVNLSPGTHLLVARFTGTGFPLRPSESAPREVRISQNFLPANFLPADYSGLVLAGAVVITISLFFGGAFWYLRRMRGGRSSFNLMAEINKLLKRPIAPGEDTPGTPARVEHPADETSGGMAAATPDALFSRYSRVLQEHGISEAAFAVYRDLSRRVASDQQIKGYTSLTPGELSRSCRNQPYCSAFSRFVSVYETVRYGGISTGTVRTEFEVVLQHTEKQMGGEDHQE
jgi:hypothetical protein